MSISDKTRKALEQIGLTSYEIKTFTSLLKSGELTASDLSQKSGVPYSKIYEICVNFFSFLAVFQTSIVDVTAV